MPLIDRLVSSVVLPLVTVPVKMPKLSVIAPVLALVAGAVVSTVAV